MSLGHDSGIYDIEDGEDIGKKPKILERFVIVSFERSARMSETRGRCGCFVRPESGHQMTHESPIATVFSGKNSSRSKA
jgi:hypothetical protein